MALPYTADELKAIVLEEFACSVCIELFSNPVTLPTCGHTFCMACINTYWRIPSSDKRCPVCRAEHHQGELPLVSIAIKNVLLGMTGHVPKGDPVWRIHFVKSKREIPLPASGKAGWATPRSAVSAVTNPAVPLAVGEAHRENGLRVTWHPIVDGKSVCRLEAHGDGKVWKSYLKGFTESENGMRWDLVIPLSSVSQPGKNKRPKIDLCEIAKDMWKNPAVSLHGAISPRHCFLPREKELSFGTARDGNASGSGKNATVRLCTCLPHRTCSQCTYACCRNAMWQAAQSSCDEIVFECESHGSVRRFIK